MRLFERVDKQLIMSRTGHRSADVRVYKRISVNQRQELSDSATNGNAESKKIKLTSTYRHAIHQPREQL